MLEEIFDYVEYKKLGIATISTLMSYIEYVGNPEYTQTENSAISVIDGYLEYDDIQEILISNISSYIEYIPVKSLNVTEIFEYLDYQISGISAISTIIGYVDFIGVLPVESGENISIGSIDGYIEYNDFMQEISISNISGYANYLIEKFSKDYLPSVYESFWQWF